MGRSNTNSIRGGCNRFLYLKYKYFSEEPVWLVKHTQSLKLTKFFRFRIKRPTFFKKTFKQLTKYNYNHKNLFKSLTRLNKRFEFIKGLTKKKYQNFMFTLNKSPRSNGKPI